MSAVRMFGDLVRMASLRRSASVAMCTGDAEAVLRHMDDLQARLELTLQECERERSSCDFYRRRCHALHVAQVAMRDPERKVVCDILANGESSSARGKEPDALGLPCTSME